jgi:flagellar basal body P-ring protein FlgI
VISLSLLLRLKGSEIKPDYKAKIVINESTRTVVIGDKANTTTPVVIAQGDLIVNVG